jgi:hypothetical protein
MSKHNNSLGSSSKGRCKCGRHMTLGEDHAGVSGYNYECPDCLHRRNSKPLTREEYYASWECSLFEKKITIK